MHCEGLKDHCLWRQWKLGRVQDNDEWVIISFKTSSPSIEGFHTMIAQQLGIVGPGSSLFLLMLLEDNIFAGSFDNTKVLLALMTLKFLKCLQESVWFRCHFGFLYVIFGRRVFMQHISW